MKASRDERGPELTSYVNRPPRNVTELSEKVIKQLRF